jgi:glycerol-3-phosphate dehydrogenase (NAD(P)+)
MFTKVTVLGGGSFGSTLADILACKGINVTLWTVEEEIKNDLNNNHKNSKYVPGVSFSKDLIAETDFNQATLNSDLIVWAIPTQAIRDVFNKNFLTTANKFYHVNVAKGIEVKSSKRISEVFEEFGVDTMHYCLLAGPSHAEEIGLKMATAICSISNNSELALAVQKLFMTDYLRVYTNPDLIGSELAGAFKNVVAIAAGIGDGFGLGDNAKAALMTRSLFELSHLVKKLGGQQETLSGLTGVGDLIATCCSKHSRNRHVGEEIGKGKSLTEVLGNMVQVAEGVKTCEAFYHISKEHSLDMPIVEATYNILFKNANVKEALYKLMTRAAKVE